MYKTVNLNFKINQILDTASKIIKTIWIFLEHDNDTAQSFLYTLERRNVYRKTLSFITPILLFLQGKNVSQKSP